MRLTENVPLSSLTTFKIGGAAQYVATCMDEADIQTALAFARERSLPWYVVGGGSNILAGDAGYEGVIIRPLLHELRFENAKEFNGELSSESGEEKTEAEYIVIAGAGVVWDVLVQETVERGLWGLENLAGIPGLVGGAPVQNIGAYGTDVSETLLYVDALDTTSTNEAGAIIRFTKEDCAFEYRESRFKKDSSLIILRVAFQLSLRGTPKTGYADLARYQEAGNTLDTPSNIAEAVRNIRARKFPDLGIAGTAGSFFKNPILTTEQYLDLKKQYPDLPGFSMMTPPDSDAVAEFTKIPLAWILDHVLHVRGFSKGPVRLFENQPLVVTSDIGATQKEVDALAQEVERRVFDATGIRIEREVRML